MPKWMVRLVGLEKELQLLLDGMTTRSCRVIKGGSEFYLHSQRFDPLGEAWAVKDMADTIIEHASLAALVRRGRCLEISTASVIEENQDGSRTPYEMLAPAEEVCEALPLDIMVGEQRQVSSADIAVFNERPALAEAAAHLRGDPDWCDYWKAAEALGKVLGGLKQGNGRQSTLHSRLRHLDTPVQGTGKVYQSTPAGFNKGEGAVIDLARVARRPVSSRWASIVQCDRLGVC